MEIEIEMTIEIEIEIEMNIERKIERERDRGLQWARALELLRPLDRHGPRANAVTLL